MSATDLTQVDFYILNEQQSPHSILQFCCRLTEKAWKLGNTIHVRTSDENETRHLDDLMWTYNDVSFLPHSRQGEAANSRITLGHGQPDTSSCDLLINLAADTPDNPGRFPRIAEILNDDESVKQSGRLRYTQYQKSGCMVQHHQIGR